MEPLPKERSDQWTLTRPGQAGSGSLNGAAPEGAERRPVLSRPVRQEGRASMEPLPKERSDDPQPRRPLLRAAAQASMEPLPKERSDGLDRRRPRRPGTRASMEPLPKERSDDAHVSRPVSLNSLPQWSRSRRSGATLASSGPFFRDQYASMEPLPKERSDGSGRSAARRCRHRLNGAAPEGAERPVSG